MTETYSQPDATAHKIEILGALDKHYFPYDFVQKVLGKMDAFYEMSQAAARANIMLLYGESGCGKSTLAEKYRDKIKRLVPTQDDSVAVLLVSTPSNCTIKSLASHILVRLGDPLAFKGTVPELTRRVIGLIKDKKITLLILDEFQHLIDRKSDKIAYDVADWVKSIVNEISCPVMIVGLPSTRRIIGHNEQLERRVSASAQLSAFPYEQPDDIERFHVILALFARELPFANREIIADPVVAAALHQASNGLIGRVVKLLQAAGINAVLQHKESLEISHFSAAFIELTSSDERHGRKARPNPFEPTSKAGLALKSETINPFIVENQPSLL